MLSNVKSVEAPRGFVTYTGTYRNTEVSVIATGMGAAMMDFVVREARFVVEGPMAIVRLGTCGARGLNPGTVAGAGSSVFVTSHKGYEISPPEFPDPKLTELVGFPQYRNATTDSFYSSQGRRDPNFDDRNNELRIDATTMEMETYHLFRLARIAAKSAPIHAAAAAIVCADRDSGDVIATETLHAIELSAGTSVLDALVAFDLTSEP
ncbi:hypothetical protein CTAYLR_006905 [Chrysophaeum taylorii]|uniref:Nucleoside phosphorylase domain-containing protein n=1 Tax=Chrysophaeum taylorii TaxID=2483200 RepID=A0AAD7UHB8_9STRA|nr:hypothetical protein CTAYLR_006905 [Chrysophaeum taylorii]